MFVETLERWGKLIKDWVCGSSKYASVARAHR
jgi:hypothetical protein